MAKSTTQSFVVTRRIITGKRGYDKLNKIERITERMYNAGVRHCIKQLVELKKMSGISTAWDSSLHAGMRKKANNGAGKYSYVLPHTSLPNTTFMRTSEEARLPDMKAGSGSISYRKLLLPYTVQLKRQSSGRRSTSANMKKHFLLKIRRLHQVLFINLKPILLLFAAPYLI